VTGEAKILAALGVVTTLILVGGLVLLGSGPTAKPATSANLIPADSYQTGPSGAKVAVVEFADFQCPACAAAAPIVKQLEKDYAGRVNFVFRHFPLSVHANAQIAAQAGEAAGDQGKFWEMYHLIYQNQANWQGSTAALDLFTSYAQSLGLDTAKFKDSASNYRFIDKVRRDQKDGESLGVNSTPTFFVNGVKYLGVLSYAQFKAVLDPLLTQ